MAQQKQKYNAVSAADDDEKDNPKLIDMNNNVEYEDETEGYQDKDKQNETTTFCCKLFGDLLFMFDIVYIVFLISLLYQPWFKYVREYLSGYTSQPEREVYAENCDFTLSNLIRNLDIFLFTHFATNMTISFALRNRLFCWVNSIMWEIIEFTYSYFPIFNYQYAQECWWDTIIIDILVFNALGIEIGLLILKYILRDSYPLYPEWKRAFIALFGNCRWRMKYIVIIFNLLFLFSMIQLFSFAFWEYTLWLTAAHWLSGIRYMVVGFSAIPGFVRLYEWMFMDEMSCCSKSSLIHNRWIIAVWTILILELLLTVRHYVDE